MLNFKEIGTLKHVLSHDVNDSVCKLLCPQPLAQLFRIPSFLDCACGVDSNACQGGNHTPVQLCEYDFCIWNAEIFAELFGRQFKKVGAVKLVLGDNLRRIRVPSLQKPPTHIRT